MAAEPLATHVRLPLPVDLALTLGPLRHGPRDPTLRFERGVVWRATRTPEGPATARFRQTGEGVEVLAWGPGAEWALAGAPELLGSRDSLEGFAPGGTLAELHRRLPGLRIGRSRAIYEALVPLVCGQRVTFVEAQASYRRIVLAWGEPAPGPAKLALVPTPQALAARPSYDLRAFGVELKRAANLRSVARRAEQLEKAVSLSFAEAHRRLLAVDGVGPWTAAHVALVALGDADAVPLGDDNLPDLVTYAFTGEPRGDDARMLELLAAYAGHRGRVIRILFASGIRAPRFAPRRRISHRI